MNKVINECSCECHFYADCALLELKSKEKLPTDSKIEIRSHIKGCQLQHLDHEKEQSDLYQRSEDR